LPKFLHQATGKTSFQILLSNPTKDFFPSFFVVLELEPRALPMVGKHPITELYAPSPEMLSVATEHNGWQKWASLD
jgi:hypothetical protein